jgi:hypothetical protein
MTGVPDPALVTALQAELQKVPWIACPKCADENIPADKCEYRRPNWPALAALVASRVGPIVDTVEDVLKDSETSPLAQLLRNDPRSSYAKLERALAALPRRREAR